MGPDVRQGPRSPVRWIVVGVVALATAAACFDSRDRPTVPVLGDLFLTSDPPGAGITVDGRALEAATPTILQGVPAGEHRINLGLAATPDEFFSWVDTVIVPEEALDTVEAALEGGCARGCPFLVDRGRVHCRITGWGDTCADVSFAGNPALQWPGRSDGSYGAGGRLLLGAVIGAGAGDQVGDTLTTLVFDTTWIGRRPVTERASGNRQALDIEYWGTSSFRGGTLLGLQVNQIVVAVDSATVEDMLFLHFQVRNISREERYRRLYPWIPEGGYTFESLYIGFGLDADVGESLDDLGSFDPDLDLSFLYDADFQEVSLGEDANRPALVGLVTVEPPEGATDRRFTVWPRSADWDESRRHGFGWRVLGGALTAGDPLSDHPSSEIGHISKEPNDYRVIETHGPLSLAPGESISLTVALVLARPVPGTFTPGLVTPAGDPLDPNRAILGVAGDLRALAAQAPELWERYRP